MFAWMCYRLFQTSTNNSKALNSFILRSFGGCRWSEWVTDTLIHWSDHRCASGCRGGFHPSWEHIFESIPLGSIKIYIRWNGLLDLCWGPQMLNSGHFCQQKFVGIFLFLPENCSLHIWILELPPSEFPEHSLANLWVGYNKTRHRIELNWMLPSEIKCRFFWKSNQFFNTSIRPCMVLLVVRWDIKHIQ